MLIKEQMQLIKRWAGDLPMRLLIQITEGHRIGKQLVQLCGHFQPYGLFEFKR